MAKKIAPKAKRTTPAKRPKEPAKRGGKRPRGRPAEKLPDEIIKRLGEVPQTAHEIRTWCAKLLAEVLALSIAGRIAPGLAATVRANVGALNRTLPPVKAVAAGDLNDPDDDDEPDDEDGPELDAAGWEGVRVG